MRYKIKYQTRGKVETYIAITTALIATLGSKLIAEYERYSILQNISDEVLENASMIDKGLSANPKCEIDDIAMTLSVYNTTGREVLLVYFEREYEKNEYRQMKRL